MPERKLPQKLAELDLLLAEIEMGWLAKSLLRLAINKLGFTRIADKLSECADAAVDDYFTSRAAEWTIESKFRSMAKDWAKQTAEAIDRWAT